MPSEHEHQGDQQRASRHGCPARGRLEQIPAKRCAINLGKRHSHDARGLEDDIEPGEHETGYGTRQ
jgi:hypothetical protein